MDPSKDATGDEEFLRPGDPGFSSFPKHLPEDCVSYSIYVLNKSLTSPSTLRSRLLEIQKAANELVKSLLTNYIWQRESFSLSILPNALSDTLENTRDSDRAGDDSDKNRNHVQEQILHLHGSTNFGDSIADEWLIVFILAELSKKFDDAWIRVWDVDGEFLLAEAAHQLPKWVNPEIAENRVWINTGRLLIIQRSVSSLASSNDKSTKLKSSSNSLTIPRHLTLPVALDLIQKHASNILLHDSSIEAEAFRRIQNYPADISLSMHTSTIPIPRNLAYLIHRNPSYISSAIEAFYLRDPIAMKPLRDDASRNDLIFRPEDCVDVSVKFTRVGFAQLRGQEFPPPQPWRAFVTDSADELSTRYKKEISMKVCCGFDMLIRDPKNKDDRKVREMKLLLDDVENGEDDLPSNAEIGTWEKVEDDESWLDIDFTEFEKKLATAGQTGKDGNHTDEDSMWGFKDKATEEKTRMLMERLVSLMNEGENDGDDSSQDEMDFDDDEDEDDGDDDDDDDEGEYDEEIHNSNDIFGQSRYEEVRRRMGLPAESSSDAIVDRRIEELDADDEPIDPDEMKKAMAEMEAELRNAGIFER